MKTKILSLVLMCVVLLVSAQSIPVPDISGTPNIPKLQVYGLGGDYITDAFGNTFIKVDVETVGSLKQTIKYYHFLLNKGYKFTFIKKWFDLGENKQYWEFTYLINIQGPIPEKEKF